MKRILTATAFAMTLSACGSTVIMDKSPQVKMQPEISVKTDGDFWGFGSEGTFDIGGKYQGKYSRSASSSTWFNTFSFKDGEMGAEITRKDNGETWQLSCTGGGSAIHYMGVDFGGNDPYVCKILQDNKPVGEYRIEPKATAIDLGFDKTEQGTIRIGNVHFNLKTIHTGDGLLMPVDMPLGYSFSRGTQEVAAVQTNGMITLQSLPSLSKAQQDLIAVGTIASALSWRPSDE